MEIVLGEIACFLLPLLHLSHRHRHSVSTKPYEDSTAILNHLWSVGVPSFKHLLGLFFSDAPAEEKNIIRVMNTI